MKLFAVRQFAPTLLVRCLHSFSNLKLCKQNKTNSTRFTYKMSLKIKLHFGGGAELLFDKIKKREVELPALSKYLPNANRDYWTIRELLVWIKDNLLKERPELFLQGESVRPGILVLINDADWELSGELEYQLQADDVIMFISTLHGG